MLKLTDVCKSFPQRGTVLDHLCLEVAGGETIAVTGPSGSGKTTLLNLVSLLDRPDEGEIIYRGKPLNNFSHAESSEYRSLHTGFIFQDHLLMPYLTVIENILFPVYARKLSGGEMNEARQRALMMAERTGISGILEKFPFQISGGEAQRTALVRALINKPSILLADEPTGSLDPSNAEILGNLLKEISETEGTAVILATHSEKLAGRMAAIYRLVNGKLVRI